MDHSLEMAEKIIVRCHRNNSDASMFHTCRMEAIHFIHCINDLHRRMHRMVAGGRNSNPQRMLRCQFLMQIAAETLRREFYQILAMNRAALRPDLVSVLSDGDDDSDYVELSICDIERNSTVTAIENLRLTAECMISSGYVKECVDIYRVARKSVIDESIYNLGVEKVTRKVNVSSWTNAVTTGMKTLFTGEKILCDHVFRSSDSVRDWCFSQVVTDAATILFRFPEQVIKHSKQTKEKVLEALHMHAAISDNLPGMEAIFSSNSTRGIKSQAIKSLDKLSEFVRAAIDKFESSILRDPSKLVPEGTGIHNLTVDSMDYLKSLADYSNILPEILANHRPPTNKHLPVSYFISTDSPPVSLKMAWLLLAVLCKLDNKSHHCKDASTSYLFLANNLRYIIGEVRKSKLGHILGEEWVTKHEALRHNMVTRGLIPRVQSRGVQLRAR